MSDQTPRGPEHGDEAPRDLHLQESGQEAPGSSASELSHLPIILVVEDDEPIAEAIVVVLEDAGYRPVWAANGQLALEAARSQWPDLILTDLMMPRMDGVDLIRALRAFANEEGRPMPPVVLMTASGLGVRRAVELGVADVVLKPFDVYKLEALVTRLIEQSHSDEERA